MIFENTVYGGYDVALGDIDNDGRPDAVVADYLQSNSVWRNTGTTLAYFDTFVSDRAMSVDLGDVDNDGHGVMGRRGPGLGTANSFGGGLGDLNDDNTLDLFVANAGTRNQMWYNPIAPTTRTPNDFDGDGKADIAVYWTATGQWYIKYSAGGSAVGVSWGWQDAIPPTQTMLHWLSGQ